jgi:hypothetical protein
MEEKIMANKNPQLSKMMKTPYVKYFICDELKRHIEVTHGECFADPIAPDQRWYAPFDEKDPKNDSNICVRLYPDVNGKKVGNRFSADKKSDIREKEDENRCLFLGTTDCHRKTCADCKSGGRCKVADRKGNGVNCERKCETCTHKQKREYESLDALRDFGDGDKAVYIEIPAPNNTETEVEQNELKAACVRAFSILPGNYPQLAYDVLILEMTERELAPKYGCSPKTIGNRKREILAILQENDLLQNLYNAL